VDHVPVPRFEAGQLCSGCGHGCELRTLSIARRLPTLEMLLVRAGMGSHSVQQLRSAAGTANQRSVNCDVQYCTILVTVDTIGLASPSPRQ
jgi:hypothetical protein